MILLSGWVIGLTTETSDKKIRVDGGSYSVSDDARIKLVKLKYGISTLEV